MILSKQKQNYVLDKVIEVINASNDYGMDKLSFSKTFKLVKNTIDGYIFADKVSLYFYENKLSKVTLYRTGGDVEIESDGHKNKFELIENLMYEKVQEIDNKKFKIIFPEYDLMEERNDILDELLSGNNRAYPLACYDESKEEVEEVKEEVKETSTIKRKKLFGIF